MTTEYTKNFGLALPDFRSGPWHDLVNGDFTKLDQLIYGAMSEVDTSPWQNSTEYAPGNTAFDTDSATTWMCTVDHVSAATGTFLDERTAHPTYWTQLLAGFAPRGEWQHSTFYFPYDLAYSTTQGIVALCTTKHVSNASGTIRDDHANWSFLVDFGSFALGAANTVSYNGATSGIPKSNVQDAIDYVETQIHGLDSVNVTQGGQISALQTEVNTHDSEINSVTTRVTNVEAKNTAQDATDANLQNQINNIHMPDTSGLMPKSGGAFTGNVNFAPSSIIQTAGAVNSSLHHGPQHGAMSFLVDNSFGGNFGLANDGQFYYGGWSFGNVLYKIWSTQHFSSQPVVSGRLVFALDYKYIGALMYELNGAVIAGIGSDGLGNLLYRFRYVQLMLGDGTWITLGYA